MIGWPQVGFVGSGRSLTPGGFDRAKTQRGCVMRGKRFWFCAVVLLGGVLMVSSALALTPDPECIAGARSDFESCVQGCKEDLREAKDLCRHINHDCAEGCRVVFEGCVENPLTTLAGCKAGCNDDLIKGRAWCRGNTKWGTTDRDKCIDLVQLRAFSCRDQCREDVQADLTQCRQDFRDCIHGCFQPAEP